MSESSCSQVIDQRTSHLAIAQRLESVLLAPGTRMNFVDAHGRPQCVSRTTFFHPTVIAPLELAIVPHDSRRLWRPFEQKAERVRFKNQIAPHVLNLELVERPF